MTEKFNYYTYYTREKNDVLVRSLSEVPSSRSLHRDDGPALIYMDDYWGIPIEEWWFNSGKLHRVNGPAYIQYELGKIKKTEWYLYGQILPFYKVENWIEENHIDTSTKKGQLEFVLKWG